MCVRENKQKIIDSFQNDFFIILFPLPTVFFFFSGYIYSLHIHTNIQFLFLRLSLTSLLYNSIIYTTIIILYSINKHAVYLHNYTTVQRGFLQGFFYRQLITITVVCCVYTRRIKGGGKGISGVCVYPYSQLQEGRLNV